VKKSVPEGFPSVLTMMENRHQPRFPGLKYKNALSAAYRPGPC